MVIPTKLASGKVVVGINLRLGALTNRLLRRFARKRKLTIGEAADRLILAGYEKEVPDADGTPRTA